MTFPIDIHLGQIIIPSHLIFEIFSFYVAFKLYLYLRTKSVDHISEDNRWTLIVGAAAGALIGSRFIAALENPHLFFHPPTWLYYYANKTIVGGIIGGIIGVEIIKKFLKEKRATGDLFAYPLILGIMVGRIGCALTGVSDGTAGLPSNLPWAFDQGDGIARHPTAIYEILSLGLLWLVLRIIQKKYNLENGVLFRLTVIGYLVFRVLIDFLKPSNPMLLGLTSIQLFALAFAIYYIFRIFVHRPIMRKKVK